MTIQYYVVKSSAISMNQNIYLTTQIWAKTRLQIWQDEFWDNLHNRIADIALYYLINFTAACILAGIMVICFVIVLYQMNRKLDKKLKEADKEVYEEKG